MTGPDPTGDRGKLKDAFSRLESGDLLYDELFGPSKSDRLAAALLPLAESLGGGTVRPPNMEDEVEMDKVGQVLARGLEIFTSLLRNHTQGDNGRSSELEVLEAPFDSNTLVNVDTLPDGSVSLGVAIQLSLKTREGDYVVMDQLAYCCQTTSAEVLFTVFGNVTDENLQWCIQVSDEAFNELLHYLKTSEWNPGSTQMRELVLVGLACEAIDHSLGHHGEVFPPLIESTRFRADIGPTAFSFKYQGQEFTGVFVLEDQTREIYFEISDQRQS